MTALAAIVGQTSRLNLKMAVSATDEVRCKWACRAGTENAIAILAEDLRDTDCLLDTWSDNEEDFNDVVLERCRYTVRVTDEAGKLNINTVTKEQLMALPNMEEAIADAILDWRDGDDDPQAQGAEAGYYENLPVPYTIRNGPLRTIRELLRVKGVTEELLYGEDTNLNGQLDANERDRDLSPPFDNGDDVLDQGWIAFLTCYSYEKNVDADGNAADQHQPGQPEAARRGTWGSRPPRPSGLSIIAAAATRALRTWSTISSPKTAPQSSGGGQNQAEPIDLQTFGQIADKITISGEDEGPGQGQHQHGAAGGAGGALRRGWTRASNWPTRCMANRASLMYGFQSIAELARPAGDDRREVQGHCRADHRSLGRVYDPLLRDGRHERRAGADGLCRGSQ